MLFSAGTMLPPSVQPKSFAPALNASESKRVCWPSVAATYWSSERRFRSAEGIPVKMRGCEA